MGCSANSFLKVSIKTVWVCLYFLVVFRILALSFLRKLCHMTRKLRPIITLKYPEIIKHSTFLIYFFQRKCNLNGFLGLTGSRDLS